MLILKWVCDRCGVIDRHSAAYEHNDLVTRLPREWRNHALSTVPEGWVVKQHKGRWELFCPVCQQGWLTRMRASQRR